jgi:ParB family chromosome partitioning protein
MSRGGITSFVGLADQVGENSPVDGTAAQAQASAAHPAGTLRSVPLEHLAANPYNPRDSLGNLDGLASIVERQLTPAVAVSVAKFKKLYPDAEITGRFVIINGNRRLAAARKFGRPELDVVVREDIAADKATLLTAAIIENVDRAGFDVIEEAKAVDRLVGEYGSTDAAATHLSKSHTWVSQRRALLALAPQLQEALRRGDLAIRTARELAKVPLEEQVARWAGTLPDATGEPAAPVTNGAGPRRGSGGVQTGRARSLSRALRKFDTDPAALAVLLREELGDTGTKTLIGLLRKLP